MNKPIKRKIVFRIILKGRAKVFVTKLKDRKYIRVVYNFERLERSILKQLIKPILEVGRMKAKHAILGGNILLRFPTDISNKADIKIYDRMVRR